MILGLVVSYANGLDNNHLNIYIMDKMEKIEKGKERVAELAEFFGCTSYLSDPQPSSEETDIRVRAYFFDRLKRDVAQKLSTIEAYYVASNNFADNDDCKIIFTFLSDILANLNSFLSDYKDSVLCEEEEEEAE